MEKSTYQPKDEKRKKIADYFGVSLEYLDTGDEESYYLNPETARLAQEMFDDPEMRALFDIVIMQCAYNGTQWHISPIKADYNNICNSYHFRTDWHISAYIGIHNRIHWRPFWRKNWHRKKPLWNSTRRAYLTGRAHVFTTALLRLFDSSQTFLSVMN